MWRGAAPISDSQVEAWLNDIDNWYSDGSSKSLKWVGFHDFSYMKQWTSDQPGYSSWLEFISSHQNWLDFATEMRPRCLALADGGGHGFCGLRVDTFKTRERQRIETGRIHQSLDFENVMDWILCGVDPRWSSSTFHANHFVNVPFSMVWHFRVVWSQSAWYRVIMQDVYRYG